MKSKLLKNETKLVLICSIALIGLLECLAMFTDWNSLRIAIPCIGIPLSVIISVIIGRTNVIKTIRIKNRIIPSLVIILPVLVMNIIVYILNPIAASQMTLGTIWAIMFSLIICPIVFRTIEKNN